MLLTEEEAKTKRCCGPEGTGIVHFGGEDREWIALWPGETKCDSQRFCIASQCMAWRLHNPFDEIGFCGLAGKVEE